MKIVGNRYSIKIIYNWLSEVKYQRTDYFNEDLRGWMAILPLRAV